MSDEPREDRRAFTVEGEVLRMREQVETIRQTLHQTNLSAVALQGNMQLLTTHMDAVQHGIEQLQVGFDARLAGFDARYAAKGRFEIVERVVLGVCGLILVTVIGAMLAGILPGQRNGASARPTATGVLVP